MGRTTARRQWRTLAWALVALACLPASANASRASERRAAERSLSAARRAVSAELAREIKRVTIAPAPPVAWSEIKAPVVREVRSEPPVALEPPQLSGGLHMGGTVTCSRGVWDDTPEAPYPVTYQWLKDGVAVASTPTLPLERSDIGKTLVCAVTASAMTEARSEEAVVPEPEAVEEPRFVGQPYVGRELFCNPGEWNDSPDARYDLTYRWERHRYERTEPMPGVHEVYSLTPADIDSSFTCIVTAEGEWSLQTRWVYTSWTPVAMKITPLDDAVLSGADGGYRITLRNPNPFPVHPDEVWMHLPANFTYRAGSATGALTADPQIYTDSDNEQSLTWPVDLVVPAGGQLTFGFGVKTTTTLGDHFMRGRVSLDDPDVWVDELYETARITVEPPFTAVCTITGTAGDDVLTGTPGDDVICGLGGDDVLRGLAGNDLLHAGDGSDRLDGGEDDDTLLGGDGEDVLVTGPGADLMRGGGGLDSVSYADRRTPVEVTVGDGGGSDGEYVPAEGDDVAGDIEIVRGGRAGDHLSGTANHEEFYGGAGDDEIWPGDGEDLVEGGDGSDFIDSGSYDAFTDRIFCGGGYDAYSSGGEDRLSACERYIRRPEAP